MKLTKIMLGGVTIAALMSNAPAFSYTRHPGTPAEHQQTEDLNQQQRQQLQSDTTSTASATQGADQMAQTAPSAAPTDAQASTAAPMTTADNTGSTIPLDSVSNAPQTLANASVETNNGQAVGAVQRVSTDAAGKVKTVVVALLGKTSRLVAIAANQLTFDQSRNVVVAQLSADQIDSLPMAPQS